MNPKDPSRVLDEISHEHVRQDLNLLPGVLAQIQQGKHPMKPVNKMRLALLLLALVLLFTFFSLPGVASALQKLLGYVPGVGLVDQSTPLRVLSHPVSDSRDGYTITIESALLDSTQTTIKFKVEGSFPEWGEPYLMPKMCGDFPFLRLADGKTLIHPGGGGGGEWKLIYPATSANHVVMVFPCLSELPAGDGPLNWEIPLDFVPAPPEMTVYPVLDLPTPTAASASGIQLTLRSVAQIQTGYYLQAQLNWPIEPGIAHMQAYPDGLHVFDSTGQEVSLTNNDLLEQATEQTLPINFETSGPMAPGPARMVLDYVGVVIPPAQPVSFTVDVGEHPQPGQSWTLNQDLLINGYKLKIRSAEYVAGATETTPTLLFHLEAPQNVLFAAISDDQHPMLSVGGGSFNSTSTEYPFLAAVSYDQAFPTGKITLNVFRITVRRNGPWSVTWTPPVSDSIPTPGAVEVPESAPALPTLAAETACIQDSTIQAAQPIPQTEPGSGLTGHISFQQYHSDALPTIGTSNLDGSHPTTVGSGYGSVLSNDASQMVYLGADHGIHIYTLASQSDMLIPNTIQENFVYTAPAWSPDGQQIAFNRLDDAGKDHIYLVNADGSNLHALSTSPNEEKLLGFTPDSTRIFYVAALADGKNQLRTLDLKTGDVQEIAPVLNDMTEIMPFSFKLSPDGKRIIHTNTQGVFLITIGASLQSTVLIANRDKNEFGTPVWSPDGKWVSLSFWSQKNTNVGQGPPMVLIQPDTCQFVLLQGQQNEITSWVP